MEILQRTAWLWPAAVLLVACAMPQRGASQAPQSPQAPAQTPQAAPAATAPAGESPLQRRARDVAALFRAAPSDGAAGGYAALFDAEFLTQVPPAQLTALFTDFYAKFGPCIKVTPVSAQNPFAGKFDFLFEKGYSAPVTLGIEAAAPHQIVGLHIGNAVRLAATLSDVVKEIKALPGRVSFLLVEIDGAKLKPLAAHNPDRALAIGSTFKLYILAELIRAIRAGERRWTDVVALNDRAVSLPSGQLREWPIGSPLTLHTLAALMISRSDNTATDQLLHTLGRTSVEKVMAVAGHSKPGLNMPFLSTREMFAIKGDPARKAGPRYAAADIKARRALLEADIARIKRDDIRPLSKPTLIDSVEWFASASDLCRAMNWIRAQTENGGSAKSGNGNNGNNGNAAMARGILAINPGIALPAEKWPYIGYKGGSEPGVLNLTWLLRGANGKWYAMSAGWNNSQATVDEGKFIGLVERATQLVP